MAVHKADLKQRVIASINKLSDRDTFSMATTDIERIARDLPHDCFSSFISCISTTDSEKVPVRRQCVLLLALLSESHRNSLSPFLPKMLSFVIRRLRDSDSAVRSACVQAVTVMSSKITKPPFSAFLKPLFDSLTHEQDYNSQIGSALCLAAAIEASPDPEPVQLMKLLPKLLKLLKSESFKAKPALLSLIGGVVEAGGASNRSVLTGLVRCLVDYLRNSDWAARKAAAEALGKVAAGNRDMVMELRSTCLASLQSRRFDKVKIVRETMTRTLDLWQEVPGVSTDSPLTYSPSNDGINSGHFDPTTPGDASSGTTSKLKNSSDKVRTPISPNPENKGSSPSRIEVSMPYSHCSNTPEDDANINTSHFMQEAAELSSFKIETKRALHFAETQMKNKFSSRSRVIPLPETDQCCCSEQECRKRKEDLSVIHKQLIKIESHQSSLLDLLQRFIGSCQSGMTSLESRVRCLELTLEKMSRDMDASSGRTSRIGSASGSCCKFPGTEFLAYKFW